MLIVTACTCMLDMVGLLGSFDVYASARERLKKTVESATARA
jgi:hypothetical protein